MKVVHIKRVVTVL